MKLASSLFRRSGFGLFLAVIGLSCGLALLSRAQTTKIQSKPTFPAPLVTGSPGPKAGVFSPDYTVTTSTGASIVPGTTDIGLHNDDFPLQTIALPFPVIFYDEVFTFVDVSSNGYLTFNGASSYNFCVPTSSAQDLILAASLDMITQDSANGEGVFTSTSGSAPNRVFNIEWRTVPCCGGGAPNINFEVRLYEGQRRIDFIYGDTSGHTFNGIGIQRDTGSQFTVVGCSNAPAVGTQYSFTAPATTSCAPAPAGLVSWWKGEGNTEDTQDGNNGTFNGTPAYASGEVGQAFSFDGSNYVSVPPATNLDLTQFTIDAWIYPTSDTDAAYIVDKSGTGTNYYLALTSDHHAEFGFQDGSYRNVDSTGVIPTNTWTHLAGSYDGATLKLYVNGALNATQAYSGTPPVTGQVRIGVRSDAQFPVIGLVDEVEIFNRALSDTEVASFYIAGSNGKCPCTPAPEGMIAWWKGEGDATDSQDGHDGTINGATFAPGEVRQAFSFDGVDDNVQIPDSSDWNFGTGDFTFDFWANSSSTNRMYALDFAPIDSEKNLDFDFNDSSNNIGLWVYWNSGGGVNGTNAIEVGNYGAYTDGQWHHFALTRSGSTWTLYIDSVVAGTATDNEALDLSGANNNYLGAFAGGSLFWNGLIDEVEIFHRALTADEVAAIYGAGAAGKCRTCTTAPAGMVSWWKAEGNAVDSEDGNNGALGSGVTFAAGKVGQAFQFDGSNNGVVTVPDAPNLRFTTAFTLDAWIYPNPLTTGILFSKINGSGTSIGYEFDVFDDGRLILFISSDGSTYDSRSSPLGIISANQWQHVAVTFDNGTVQFFLNGALVGTDTFNSSSVFPGTDNLLLGSNLASANFAGLIDEAEAFGRALGQSEIQKIFDAGSEGKCPCTPAPSGMVSWWPGDLNPFDYQDSNHGALVGGASYTSGEVGEAFNFDGSTGYVSIPHNTNQSIQSAITIDAWVMKKGTCTNNCIVVMKQTADGACCDNLRYGLIVGGGFGVDAGRVDFAFNTGSWEDVVLSNTILQDNVWYHIAGTYDSVAGKAKIYINGTLDNTADKTGLILPSTTGNLYIGRDSTGNSEFFNGAVDEVELFDTALSADNIAAIYHAGGAGKCKPQSTPTPSPTPTATPSPTTTPTPTPAPISQPKEVDGSGAILSPVSGEATFDLDVRLQLKNKKKTAISGGLGYSDLAAGLSFRSTKITALSFSGRTAHITGTAKLSKKKSISFTADATDNGPGTLDTFSIHVSNGYSASGNLLRGNIVIQ